MKLGSNEGLEHLGHAGEGELALTVSGGRVRISVTDDGPGIPEADTERVWDRFVRLDDDRSQESGGSGLGLAIVRELTRAHGGTATVRGRACDPGAEFIIELPLRREDQASSDQVRATAMTAPRQVPAAGTGA